MVHAGQLILIWLTLNALIKIPTSAAAATAHTYTVIPGNSGTVLHGSL